jgi:hypothetical protein
LCESKEYLKRLKKKKDAIEYFINYVAGPASLFQFGTDNYLYFDYFTIHNSFIIKSFANHNLDFHHLLLLPIIGAFHRLNLEH